MSQAPFKTFLYFNPRTPRGVRPDVQAGIAATYKDFNPRTPRGVRPMRPDFEYTFTTNFNPRTPRGVRPRPAVRRDSYPRISIHAPRVGCDALTPPRLSRFLNFNPRTPRGVRQRHRRLRGRCTLYFNPRTPRGVRPRAGMERLYGKEFQSTHPAWGATGRRQAALKRLSISIHAPRVGCDSKLNGAFWTRALFQSTHPAWGATSV